MPSPIHTHTALRWNGLCTCDERCFYGGRWKILHKMPVVPNSYRPKTSLPYQLSYVSPGLSLGTTPEGGLTILTATPCLLVGSFRSTFRWYVWLWDKLRFTSHPTSAFRQLWFLHWSSRSSLLPVALCPSPHIGLSGESSVQNVAGGFGILLWGAFVFLSVSQHPGFWGFRC